MTAEKTTPMIFPIMAMSPFHFENPIAVVFALREEVKPILKTTFQGQSVILHKTGMGMANAQEEMGRLIEAHHPRAILSVGYAGAAQPELKAGDLILPTSILSETSSNHFRPDPDLLEKTKEAFEENRISYREGPLVTVRNVAQKETKKQWGQKGILAIDMESAALIAVSIKNRIPFVSLRVIFDTLDDDLNFSPKSILKIPKLIRMNRVCQANLAKAIFCCLSAFPSFLKKTRN